MLERCDSAGEAIAAFLGITTPKYGYELDVYRRMQTERAARNAEDAEAAGGGWTVVRQGPSDEEREVGEGVAGEYVVGSPPTATEVTVPKY